MTINAGSNAGNAAPQNAQTESSAPVETGAVDWADFATDVDDGGGYVIEPDVGQVSLDTPVDNATTTPTPNPAQAPQLQSPEAQPVTSEQPAGQHPSPPTQPQPAVQPQEASEPAPQPVDYAAQVQAYRESLSTEYAISEDDALALVTNPEQVLPKLAANVHMRVMEDVARHVQQALAQVPVMLQAHVARAQAEDRAKQEFYGEWPGLSAHHDTVVSNASIIRQAHPKATKQQIIEMAGVMTAMALGLDPMSVRRQGQPQGQPRMAPVQQPAMRPTGMTPAAQGGATTSDNLFESFAEEDLNWMR